MSQIESTPGISAGRRPQFSGARLEPGSLAHAELKPVRVLLDTCVVSELRRAKGHAGVRKAIEELDSEDLFVSVISIGEITIRYLPSE